MLKSEELERYKRQIEIKSWGMEAQEKIKQSRVFVAGCGGLGSPVLLYLAAAGVGELIFCDYDHVEQSNLNRQIIYKHSDTGSDKTSIAARHLRDFNPNCVLRPFQQRLSEKNLEQMAGNCDVIVDCLDSFSARHILNRYAFKNGIPLVHGAATEFQGQVMVVIPGETACLACIMPVDDNNSASGITGPVAGFTGSLQANEVIKLITQIGEVLAGKLLIIDARSMNIDRINITKNPHCSVCGS